ncbi:hypothetical protein JQN72_12045 [Phycicoccus sp. CSK15P-2]|uniref:hypothetical protein n=1 Tax=Phycicoccus sp. CSK15P-2 TaxID=2807627 RepID=UPI001950D472|nr:hypothetical protein [Phycicoccus sp. CSK15P-2]MBM6404973.1 hypothetical protein [Phycicoccus sp. CSK15P-2]
MSFEVQKEALEHDAKIWDATGDTLSTAAGAARGIVLSTNAVSFVGDATGFTSTYADIQSFVAGLLDEGSAASSDMATTLRDVRKQYEADEQSAAQRIGDQWSPVE